MVKNRLRILENKMENPIYTVCNSVDRTVMYFANRVAHAYNWTTGRTKADLANKLLTVAPILESLGVLSNPEMSIPIKIVLPTMFLTVSHIVQRANTITEESEQRAIEKGCLNIDAEFYKGRGKVPGYLFGGAIGVHLLSGNKNNDLFYSGQLARATSHFVMATDYLPPRKNVLVRARDKLSKWLEAKSQLQLPKRARAFAIQTGSLEARCS